MRVYIIGINGQLGYELKKLFKDVSGGDLPEVNICEPGSIRKAVPADTDLIINCAAYTDVDGCEMNPTKAYNVNGKGAGNVAAVAKKLGCKLIHISTDYVFRGDRKGFYEECDKPSPVCVYGKSKLEGEQRIMDVDKGFTVVRTSCLYGFGGNNFLRSIAKALKSMSIVNVVADIWGSPTRAYSLALQIRHMACNGCGGGFYHAAGTGMASRFEWAMAFKEYAGLLGVIAPCRSERSPTTARRPECSALRNRRLERENLEIMMSWESDLEDFCKPHREHILQEWMD